MAIAGSLVAIGCSVNDVKGRDPDAGMPFEPEPAQGRLGLPDDPSSGFTEGVVTAAHPLAAQAGAEVLAAGGNAIDAAVVTQFVLNVVEPTSSGIGGGGFMGIHLAGEGRTFFIDSREKAPADATPAMFLSCDPDCDLSAENETIGDFTQRATSGLAVGVPGTLLGLERALTQYGSGTLTLAEALAPAIELAQNGFEINDRLAELTADERTAIWPETRAKFRTEAGEPLPEGFLLVQPDLARTFQAIAERGVDALYSGEIAQAIVDAQVRSRSEVSPENSGAGRMSLSDLASYRAAGVDERDGVVFDYRGYTLHGMPSPSSGGNTVGQILACMEDFPIGDAEEGFGFGSTNTLHVMAESMRLAFSSRSVWMGDRDVLTDLPDENLLGEAYLDPRCAQISTDSRIADDEVVPGDPRPAEAAGGDIGGTPNEPAGIDTTHFTVIDSEGNVVSYTSTIEGTWGSGITVPGWGFLLNNELTDFNTTPSASAEPFNPGANDVAPGKRPRSSMAPVIVFEGDDVVAAYGSPGGSTIINTVVNITTNLVDHGMTLQSAIDAPRVNAGFSTLRVEEKFGLQPDWETVQAELTTLGHEVEVEGDQGSVQAIVVDTATNTRYGGADNRRAGTVVGTPLAP